MASVGLRKPFGYNRVWRVKGGPGGGQHPWVLKSVDVEPVDNVGPPVFGDGLSAAPCMYQCSRDPQDPVHVLAGLPETF